jgi:hypothetical protein
MVITAKRDKPDAQSASLSYATPAARTAQESALAPRRHPPWTDASDDWLRRARELEAAGKRKEALQAYRQAAASLRSLGCARPLSPAVPLASALVRRHRPRACSQSCDGGAGIPMQGAAPPP